MARTRIVVLGAAAGGGYPQWNCNCPVCELYWRADPRVSARTQSSIAVTGDGESWVLFNCSPDLRSQILSTPALHPRGARRHTPIGAVVLTNGDIDHVAGLLSMRESQSFDVLATPATLQALQANPVYAVLDRSLVRHREITLGGGIDLPGGLSAELFAVPGKVPLYLEGDTVEVGAETETTIGLHIRSADGSFYYVPGCARLPDELAARLSGAPLLLFDGTLWQDDEMIAAGVGKKTGRRMGHMPISGEGGSLGAFAALGIDRKIFIHINNTNPVLVEGSAERLEAERAGWQIAYDGMEIAL